MGVTRTLGGVSVGDEIQITTTKIIGGESYLGKTGKIQHINKTHEYPYSIDVENFVINFSITEFDLLPKSSTFVKASQPKLKRILALKRHKGK